MPKMQVPGELRAYEERVISDQDRILFEEACLAQEAGALRGAFILVWLACAESLKRKFQELSPRDSVAAKVSAEIQSKEANHSAVDAYILDKAKEYGFLTDVEHQKLQHIYGMRCIYGHPYEQSPSIEELRSAAAVAVEIVLARPLKLRHGYLDEKVPLLLTDKTFLDDTYDAVSEYAKEVFSRSANDLHLWFMRKLWKEMAGLEADPSLRHFLRRGQRFSQALLRLEPDEIFSRWDAVGDLTKHRAFLSYILSDPELFRRIVPHAQDIVVGNLLDLGAKTGAHLRRIETLWHKSYLSERHKERFETAVAQLSSYRLAEGSLSPSLVCDAIVRDLKSHDWPTQNPAIGALRIIGPSKVASLPLLTQRLLGNNVLQAAHGDSIPAKALLRELPDSATVWPLAFVQGAVEETVVNAKGEIRFKMTHARPAFLALKHHVPSEVASFLEDLAVRVGTGSLKYNWLTQEDRQAALSVMDEVVATDPAHLGAVSALKRSIESLKALDDD